MKSRITKLAAAAVIVVAVLAGIHQFGGSIDGTTVAWAKVIETIDGVEVEGLEIRGTDLVVAPVELDSLVIRMWVDVETVVLMNQLWPLLQPTRSM